MTVREPAPESATDAVRIERVSRVFRRRSGWRAGPAVVALDDVTLTVPRRARFGIVGESGSGKTTLIRLIAALDRPTSGRVLVDGREISALPERQLRLLRSRLQLVFQDPMSSLDPRMRVRDIVAEPLHAMRRPDGAEPLHAMRRPDGAEPLHAMRRPDGAAPMVADRVRQVLAEVGLDESALARYPHQFSGGQRQRISIARAIAPRPSILLADEAVSALDVTSRRQILELLDELARHEDFTLLFVSHDLSVIRRVCDRVAVLKDGRVVETGLTESVYREPLHPYTRELLAAVPTLESALEAARARASGDPGAALSEP